MKLLLKKSFQSVISVACLILCSSMAMAEVKIIAHTSVADGSLTVGQASDLFLGKKGSLPGGSKAIPVDQEVGEAGHTEFYSKVAKKDAAQLKAYWSRLVFTGKGQPPKVLFDDDEVIQLVSSNPNMIGYVSGGANTGGVKVLLSVP